MIVLALVVGAGLLGWSPTAEAGRVPRPGVDADVVRPLGTVTYGDEWFDGGDLAAVTVTGDGSTALSVAVYDESGNLITSDYGYTCRLTWYPRWTGRFTIRVRNLGHYSNHFELATN
jgi:hypothetical protein